MSRNHYLIVVIFFASLSSCKSLKTQSPKVSEVSVISQEEGESKLESKVNDEVISQAPDLVIPQIPKTKLETPSIAIDTQPMHPTVVPPPSVQKKVTQKPEIEKNIIQKSVKSVAITKALPEVPKVIDSEVVKPPQPPALPTLPFIQGEEIELAVSYIGVEAGRLNFKVNGKRQYNGVPVISFQVDAKSSGLFSLFYRVQSVVKSLWDPVKKRPMSTVILGDETGFDRNIRTSYDWSTSQARYTDFSYDKKKKRKDKVDKTWKVTSPIQDFVSSLYHARSLKLEPGETHHFKVAAEGKTVDLTLKVIRREKIRTSIGKFDALVVHPYFKKKGNFSQAGLLQVWISDDEKKIPLRFKGKLNFGSMYAKVKSYKAK